MQNDLEEQCQLLLSFDLSSPPKENCQKCFKINYLRSLQDGIKEDKVLRVRATLSNRRKKEVKKCEKEVEKIMEIQLMDVASVATPLNPLPFTTTLNPNILSTQQQQQTAESVL